MLDISGNSVSKGIAMGKIIFYSNNINNVQQYILNDTYTELDRYKKALKIAKTQLQELYDYVKNNIGKDESVIFQTHIMILEDSQFMKNVENIIMNRKLNAEFAVYDTASQIAEMFKQIDDEYLQQRYFDIIDSANTLLEILDPKIPAFNTDEHSIIAAAQILPSETIKLNKLGSLGFITNKGSKNSHAAILSRSMKLPALTNINEDLSKFNGMYAILDGYNNKIIIEPDDNTIEIYKKSKIEKEVLL